MRLTTFFVNHEILVISAIITLVVGIANYHAVFGLDMLFLDDNARYFLYVNNIDTSYARSFIGLGVLLKSFAIHIFSTISVEAARAFILVAYMIPVSILFYYINRRIFYFSVWSSLASAVIINIIPKQSVIPTFLDGSYPVPGMLVFLISLIFSAQYLKHSRTNFLLLLSASICWLLVNDLVAEMGIFLFPALLYFIHSSDAAFKRKSYLYLSTSIITAYRLYFYLQSVGVNPTNKPADLSVEVIAGRIANSIEWWLPFDRGTTTAVILGALVTTMIVYTYIKTRESDTDGHFQRAYIFYGIWFISCGFPFWFLSKYFGPRYFYISYFALTTITFITIYQTFILPRCYKTRIATISLIAIFCLYGTQRYRMNANQYERWNNKNDSIYSILVNETINDDTQIALVNIKNGTGGYYMWSSGYLQHLLKKPGIRGLMGNEMNFYDPFNLKHCGYNYKMSCLDTNKELIAYKQDSSYQVIRMEYFLQWVTEEKRDSMWSLYRSDNNNKLSVISTGYGLDAYKNTLSELNLEPEQVLWGNYNDKLSVELLM